jgi:hypothetical protein
VTCGRPEHRPGWLPARGGDLVMPFSSKIGLDPTGVVFLRFGRLTDRPVSQAEIDPERRGPVPALLVVDPSEQGRT